MTNNQLPTTEELNYSSKRARRHPHPTNNLLEVCKTLVIFGGRPIRAAIKVLLMIVVNQGLSLLPIGFVFVAPCHAAGSVLV
jgi:hypothetical protein